MNKSLGIECFDVRGEPLLAGDIIAYCSSMQDMIIGLLKYDSNERKALHLIKKGGGMHYIQKPWAKPYHHGAILNLSRLPADLDSLV